MSTGGHHLPMPWDAELPGERLEGIWAGVQEDARGRAVGRVRTPHGETRVALTSVLRARVQSLHPGALVRVTFEGDALSAAGRPYRRYAIEPLLADELPDRPAPATTAPALRPGEQACLPW